MIILVLLLTIGLVYIVFYIMRIYAKKTKDKYNNTNVSSELNENVIFFLTILNRGLN